MPICNFSLFYSPWITIVNIDNNNCEACGGGPIIALLKAAALKKINQSRVLNRSDSGDVTGDTQGVVGYLSAVVYSD